MMIFVCGFMGAGKSHFVDQAQKLLLPRFSGSLFVDLDREIEKRLGVTISQMFEQKREMEFRKLESEMLTKLLKGGGKFPFAVVSLGGGALSKENIEEIKSRPWAQLVWIKTPFDVCFSRVKSDSQRPLVKKGEAYLKELYAEREPLYKLSDFVLSGEKEHTEASLLEFFGRVMGDIKLE